jgi:alkylation response protein AidB-like acyl-CoA dehydrogenase
MTMDFDLDEETQQLLAGVTQAVRQHVAPQAATADQRRTVAPKVVGTLAELGLLGLRAPESAGGVGLSNVAGIHVIERVARADAGLALLLGLHNFLAVDWLARGGRLRPDHLDRPASWAWTAAPAATAERAGAGWRLRGRLQWVPMAARPQGIVAMVPIAGSGANRIAAFWLAPHPEGVPVATLGLRSASFTDVPVEGVELADDCFLGESTGDASAAAVRTNLAAIACGVARSAMENAIAYAAERKQFGRPISSFQAIQWKLADMAVELDAAWLLTVRAAALADTGPAELALPAAAAAHGYAVGRAREACSQALQIFGGYGYTREFPIERALRDATMCVWAGTSNEQVRRPERIVARALERTFA